MLRGACDEQRLIVPENKLVSQILKLFRWELKSGPRSLKNVSTALLKAFRARAASRRLARLGTSQPDLEFIPRRRSEPTTHFDEHF
jgi:hypothetical protein